MSGSTRIVLTANLFGSKREFVHLVPFLMSLDEQLWLCAEMSRRLEELMTKDLEDKLLHGDRA